MEKIKGVIRLADVKSPPQDISDFWYHFEQMLVRGEWERFDREMEPELDTLMEKYPDWIRHLSGQHHNLMIRRVRWAGEGEYRDWIRNA